jgi:hypothetical protein
VTVTVGSAVGGAGGGTRAIDTVDAVDAVRAGDRSRHRFGPALRCRRAALTARSGAARPDVFVDPAERNERGVATGVLGSLCNASATGG